MDYEKMNKNFGLTEEEFRNKELFLYVKNTKKKIMIWYILFQQI